MEELILVPLASESGFPIGYHESVYVIGNAPRQLPITQQMTDLSAVSLEVVRETEQLGESIYKENGDVIQHNKE